MRGVGMESFDAAVIGAGVVGCAAARRLALCGARVVVLEAAADILDGASKGNSAILHTGFDAPPGSLEAACIAAGHTEYLEIHERLGLPLDRAGALVLAWSQDEAARLPALMDKARANGVATIEPLTGAAIRALEPELAPGVVAGFRVPGEYLIDPWSTPLAYLRQALANGAQLWRSCAVTGARWDGKIWHLDTAQGPVGARAVIAAAGLWGDRVEAMFTGQATFTIRPRKGQFVVFDKPAAGLVRHILLPVPTEVTKGIVVCRTVFGNLLVGPTAEEQEGRRHAPLDTATLGRLRTLGEAILPALADHEVTAVYAGLRPASERPEYRITWDADRRFLGLGAIRSTGLSAALGLARHAAELIAATEPGWRALPEPAWPRVPNISEGAARDWQCPGHGGILCHCELVTRREVEAALDGPLGARTLAGLKRRTRVTMGRCQGFYCSEALARLTEGRLTEPMGLTGD
ncbi:MAG: NAD(P)/FAD-dependent oxidoreductase [Rubellimicrobium sp.]|nr:NAD(P)/FAD-dependent oxidoreductase [Rubellimicrobium sp.]